MAASYYEILEVRRRASSDEIRLAYLRLARRWHPDRNAGDPAAEERFKAVAEAYRVLADPASRKVYDLSGVTPRGAQYVASPEGLGVRDFVQRAARAARRTFAAERGEDLRLTSQLRFDEALSGCRRIFEVPRAVNPAADEPVLEMHRLEFELPPALHDGEVLRWRGKGAPGRWGGESGDLIVTVRVKPHPRCSIRSDGLEVDVGIRPTQRILGFRSQLELPTGTLRFEVPAGSALGTVRAGRVGPPGRDGRPMEVFLRLREQMPSRLSPHQRELLERFEESMDDADVDAASGGQDDAS